MTNLTKEEVIAFQNATLDRISEHIWDYAQNTVGDLDLIYHMVSPSPKPQRHMSRSTMLNLMNEVE